LKSNFIFLEEKWSLLATLGSMVAIYDPVTGEVTNSAELEDELDFDIENFNKQVITESFNKTVLEEIANYLNPEGEGKTLIYAVDNSQPDCKTIKGEI
jgi:type I restriction enzyme, R subunit